MSLGSLFHGALVACSETETMLLFIFSILCQCNQNVASRGGRGANRNKRGGRGWGRGGTLTLLKSISYKYE